MNTDPAPEPSTQPTAREMPAPKPAGATPGPGTGSHFLPARGGVPGKPFGGANPFGRSQPRRGFDASVASRAAREHGRGRHSGS